MAGVERGDRSAGIRRDKCGSLLAGNTGSNASPGIDGRGHSSVGVTEEPAIVLNGTHTSLIQVLRICATVAIPAIIRNVHEDLRTLIGRLPDFIGENRFVADEHA